MRRSCGRARDKLYQPRSTRRVFVAGCAGNAEIRICPEDRNFMEKSSLEKSGLASGTNTACKSGQRLKGGFGFALGLPNGLRYPRWGGRRDAVRLEKCWGVEKCLESRQTPQRRVHALLGNLYDYQNDGWKKIPPPTRLSFTHNIIFGNYQKMTCQMETTILVRLHFKEPIITKGKEGYGKHAHT